MRTIIEPFRIKSVEPIRMTTRAERHALLKQTHYNLFALKSEDVMIDLLTDSGTGAMSAAQWAAIMRGDESYAGSPSFYRFEAAVKHLMPFAHVIPTHQGRAAEAILFSIFGGAGRKIPNNTHFDTTRGNIESSGATGHDFLTEDGKNPASEAPFKGNMDTPELTKFLEQHHRDVPCIMITLTNNAGKVRRAHRLTGIRHKRPMRHRQMVVIDKFLPLEKKLSHLNCPPSFIIR